MAGHSKQGLTGAGSSGIGMKRFGPHRMATKKRAHKFDHARMRGRKGIRK